MVSKVNLMSQAEYARHRGCSKVAVGKAVKANRISLVNGKIDPAVADIQWQKNSRARAGTQTSAQLPLDGGEVAAESTKTDDYMVNRNRTEAATAGRAELALAREMGEAISVAAVEATLANDYSATRDAMLQIPARISPLLAVETDPAAIQTQLYEEIHKALDAVSGSASRIKTLAVSAK